MAAFENYCIFMGHLNEMTKISIHFKEVHRNYFEWLRIYSILFYFILLNIDIFYLKDAK